MGRYLDIVGSSTNPLQGLSMDGQMNPTLATSRNPVAAIDKPEDFSLWLDGVWGDVFTWTLDSASALGQAQQHARDPAIAQVAQAAAEVGTVRRALAPLHDSGGNPAYTSPVPYPKSPDSDFPQRLAGLAAMLARGLPLRCVALTSDTQFDTHSAQTTTFDSGLSLIADSMLAFQSDIEARGLADRVLVHVWSEFGRRAQENGSKGTDHGAAGASMLIGARVKGTMIGEWPGLTRLDANGNLRENVDFRRRVLLAARAVARHRRGSRDPRRAPLPSLRAAPMSPRRLTTLALASACLTAAAVLSGGPRTSAAASRPAAAASRAPARMLVYAQEWSLWPSRASLPAGQGMIVQLWNRGQDAHDLRIRRLDAYGHMVGRAQRLALTQSGRLGQASWRLGTGRYELYCSMPGHLGLGMHARLRVR